MKDIFVDISGESIRYEYNNLQRIKDFCLKNKLQPLIFLHKKNPYFSYTIDVPHVFYNDFSEIESVLKSYKKNIFFINTYDDRLIQIVSQIKDNLKIVTSERYDMFNNKFLQRELLSQNRDLGIQYEYITLENMQERIKIPYPYIVKPLSAGGSIGVNYIASDCDYDIFQKLVNDPVKKKGNIGAFRKGILAEEYIEGDTYSIDYYVGKTGNCFLTYPVRVIDAKDVGIDDFFCYADTLFMNTKDILNFDELYKFIQQNVRVTGMKNTFVHHEFKLLKNGGFKTIEINGRIGFFRTQMYQDCLGINMFDFLYEPLTRYFTEACMNMSYIDLYSVKEGVFECFNDEILRLLKALESVKGVTLFQPKVGEMVGLSGKGYSKIGYIRVCNVDQVRFLDDFKRIRELYDQIIIISK